MIRKTITAIDAWDANYQGVMMDGEGNFYPLENPVPEGFYYAGMPAETTIERIHWHDSAYAGRNQCSVSFDVVVRQTTNEWGRKVGGTRKEYVGGLSAGALVKKGKLTILGMQHFAE